MTFKQWLEAKKVQNHDLIFTEAFKQQAQIEFFNHIAEQMALRSPSFTEGLAFLELVTDLILMGYQEDLLPAAEVSFEVWLEKLKILRFPQTHLQDQKTQAHMARLPWPQGAKLKYERRGDKYGAELKYFISTKADLVKLISALERVQKEMSS